MGCCFSLEIPNVEERLNTIEVKSSSSDDIKTNIKSVPNSKSGDIIPLLEGPEPLNFADLNFSSDSDSIDIDMKRIEQLLKENSETKNEEGSKEIFEET